MARITHLLICLAFFDGKTINTSSLNHGQVTVLTLRQKGEKKKYLYIVSLFQSMEDARHSTS